MHDRKMTKKIARHDTAGHDDDGQTEEKFSFDWSTVTLPWHGLNTETMLY